MNFSREEHSVPVKWEERIFNPCKCTEVGGLCHTDCCAVKVLAPNYVIGILYFYQSWIICIYWHKGFPVFVNKLYFIFFKIPMDCIFASSHIDIWNTIGLFSTEYSDEFISIRHYCTVKDSCYSINWISSNDWVLCITPYRRTF